MHTLESPTQELRPDASDFLQNIHLTPKWTSSWLEKRCDDLSSAHQDFRLFLSAEAAMLPINILQANCLYTIAEYE